MGQSLVKNYLHIVFSTKHREPLIQVQVENELHQKKIPLIKLLEEIKSHSSKWIKAKDDSLKNFYWQDGYGAFSVNPSEVNVVIKYITDQKDHLLHQTFQDEYRAFLKKYEVEYDERYVWD